MVVARGATRWLRRYPAGAFVILAFGISWSVWVPMAVLGTASPLKDVAAFGPAVAALAVAMAAPAPVRRAYLARLRRWRVGRRWYALVIFGPFLLVGSVAAVAHQLGVPGLQWNDPSQWYLALPAFGFVLVAGGPLGEEPGWRGWLGPALGARFGPLRASVAVGGVWAAWHIPLGAIPGTPQAELPIVAFAVQTAALGVIYGWVAHRTAASVPVALLLHAGGNTAVGIFPILPRDAGGSVVPYLILTLAICVGAALAARRLDVRDVVTDGTRERAGHRFGHGPSSSGEHHPGTPAIPLRTDPERA